MTNRKSAQASSAASPAPRRQNGVRPEPRQAPAPSRKPLKTRTAVAALPERTGARRPMDTDGSLPATEPLRERLRARIVGQDRAVDALVGAWARLLSGLRDPDRPLLTGLLLGPTGVGKTETARALAEALFGDPKALVRINCEEYANGHEVAKLLGSPPGYVGADIEPLLSQSRLDRSHWELRQRARGMAAPDDEQESPPEESAGKGLAEALIEQVHDPERGLHSILLFDEVEKAHPTLWNALLGVLEDGTITLGNNRSTDLTRSVILMTSNAGSREMGAALRRRTLGFADTESAVPDPGSLREIARQAARDLFPAEFLNRFDEILVFEPLAPEQLGEIFDKFLAGITERALARAGVPLLVRASERARRFVIDEGTDPALGARPLRRAMERLLVDPLSRLLASGQLVSGDVVEVELEEGSLAFYRLPRQGSAVVA